jgi:CDP-glucose 4,6-dehydratase
MVGALGKSLRNLPGPVLITGHTGFKGSWMTLLLQQLGVSVIGYSLQAEKGSLYDRAKLKGHLPEEFADIRNYKKLKKFIEKHKPSVIFHMAAQPLVIESYRKPLETFDVNVLGTSNLLDIAFALHEVEIVVVVTTDKVYKNDESGEAFIENDPLEGKDPYSASKVGTEAAVKAWQQISKISGGPKVVSVRAGNVIGGGDFAKDRLIPDIVRSYLTGEPLLIRNPKSIRPWQHVLDPLMGYIKTAEFLLNGHDLKSVNFGPRGEELSVQQVVEIAKNHFGKSLKIVIEEQKESDSKKIESNLLSLNSNFALETLGWQPLITKISAISLTLNWWHEVLVNNANSYELVRKQIQEYEKSLMQSLSSPRKNDLET